MAKNSFPAEVTFKGMKMYKITILTTFLNTNRNNGNNINIRNNNYEPQTFKKGNLYIGFRHLTEMYLKKTELDIVSCRPHPQIKTLVFTPHRLLRKCISQSQKTVL